MTTRSSPSKSQSPTDGKACSTRETASGAESKPTSPASTPSLESTTGWHVKLALAVRAKVLPGGPQERNIEAIEPDVRDVLRSVAKGDSSWPLLLLGGVGRGKTCAALCLMDRVSGGGWRICKTVHEMTAELIKASRSELFCGGAYPVSGDEWWRRWGDAKLTILDEIGSRGAVTDHHYESVKQAIDLRHGKPCICISNLSLPEIELLYDDRVASRLACGTVIEMVCVDRRLPDTKRTQQQPT
jgi:hypothetical protein